jgi:transcriptional regulator with XRE-family HTH domain
MENIIYPEEFKNQYIYVYKPFNNELKELSKKLNVSQSMVSKLESGEYNPTVEQLWKICDKLNWKFDILIEK